MQVNCVKIIHHNRLSFTNVQWSFGFISPKAEAIPTSALADSTKESIKKSL